MLLLPENNKVNTLELHYWLKGNEHTMNAYVQNRCELEFLIVVKEVAHYLGHEIYIETEPLANGGIRRWFKVITKGENKNAAITAAVISALTISIIVTPIATAITKTVEHVIDKMFDDKADSALDKEKKQLEIENLKLDIKEKSQRIENNEKIKKRRSNFYEELEKESRVVQFSVLLKDDLKRERTKDYIVKRDDFKKYILVNDKLEPDFDENAVIEIISPVLKKGDFKWRGIYNGEAVSFTMKSNEFKTLIQTGKIEFKNGSSINCYLEVGKSLDNEGNEKITYYSILRVNEYFENNKPIETPEGKKHRQKREADESQLGMFDDN